MAKPKALSSRELIQIVTAAGWTLVRVSGSHHSFQHATRSGLVVIPHPRKTMSRGTQRSILKMAGLLK